LERKLQICVCFLKASVLVLPLYITRYSTNLEWHIYYSCKINTRYCRSVQLICQNLEIQSIPVNCDLSVHQLLQNTWSCT
jgi:hypothetical protein